MALLLPDHAQIDPKSVWVRVGTAGDSFELYLVHRDTGELVSESLPHGCGKLPHPLQSWFNQQREAWGFRPPEGMSEDEALKLARASGFRQNLEDVSIHGDPGYTSLHSPRREKVVSARRREGRPGEAPVTVIMAVAVKVDANGFTSFEELFPSDIPSQPKLHDDCTEETFLTDAAPEEVIKAWSAQGFVERPDVVGCFEPAELFVWVSEPDDDGDMSLFVTPQGDFWMDDDLRDHSLTVIPEAVGENLCENEWEIRPGFARDEVLRQLDTAGFNRMPDEMRKRLFG